MNVRREINENEKMENDFQMIQASNSVLTFEFALWSFDTKTIEAAILGLFQSDNMRRVQIFDNNGRIVLGNKSMLHQNNLSNGSYNSKKIVADDSPILPQDALSKPSKPFSKNKIDSLILEDAGTGIKRIKATLWYQPNAVRSIQFLGHLIIEYSLDEAHSRARAGMFRSIAVSTVSCLLMISLLLFATKYTIVQPIDTLSKAMLKIVDGNFDTTVSIKSRDEIGQLSKSFDEMRIKIKDFTNNLEDKVREQTEELRGANIKLQELDMEKTRFFQNISHEFRTPLTLIMNSLENLGKIHADSNDIQIAARNSRRLFRLVTQLLEFQKYVGASKNIPLEPLNLTSLVTSIGKSFAPLCKSREIVFNMRINDRDFDSNDCHDNIHISGNIDAIEKVTFNYLSNAYKFVNKSGRISLNLNVIENHAIISVSDNGAGISKEEQKKLFNAFYQVNSTKKSGHEGTGLGLALSKELVEKMNGEVSVASTPGAGSIFSASFPLLKVMKPLIDVLFVFGDNETKNQLLKQLPGSSQISRHIFIDDILETRDISDKYLFKILACEIGEFGKYSLNALSLFRKIQPLCKIFLIGKEISEPLALEFEKHQIKYEHINPDIEAAAILDKISKYLKENNLFEVYAEKDDYKARDWLMADIESGCNKVEFELDIGQNENEISRNETVLVADDIPDMLRLIAQYLS
ncbi:MAG: HAMP domain-containing histidine kinase, partial [Oligoflexales bacterium]|nr:HAMP domain-containing histidine kinase [Oligoflexales bacterium]